MLYKEQLAPNTADATYLPSNIHGSGGSDLSLGIAVPAVFAKSQLKGAYYQKAFSQLGPLFGVGCLSSLKGCSEHQF